jgi:peroxiredoxin Q/BCP
VVVLGVSKDSIDSHNRFAGKYRLPFTLLSHPKAEVMKKYGMFGKKMMYGKEVQGTIRSTVIIGQKGDVIKHWPAVKKAEAHPDEVLAFLKRALIAPIRRAGCGLLRLTKTHQEIYLPNRK